jgi:hypothetical protein
VTAGITEASNAAIARIIPLNSEFSVLDQNEAGRPGVSGNRIGVSPEKRHRLNCCNRMAFQTKPGGGLERNLLSS